MNETSKCVASPFSLGATSPPCRILFQSQEEACALPLGSPECSLYLSAVGGRGGNGGHGGRKAGGQRMETDERAQEREEVEVRCTVPVQLLSHTDAGDGRAGQDATQYSCGTNGGSGGGLSLCLA